MPQIEHGLIAGLIGQPNNPNAMVVRIFVELGSPTASSDPLVQNAAVGSLYMRADGGSGSTLYVCEGTVGNWVAK